MLFNTRTTHTIREGFTHCRRLSLNDRAMSLGYVSRLTEGVVAATCCEAASVRRDCWRKGGIASGIPICSHEWSYGPFDFVARAAAERAISAAQTQLKLGWTRWSAKGGCGCALTLNQSAQSTHRQCCLLPSSITSLIINYCRYGQPHHFGQRAVHRRPRRRRTIRPHQADARG